MPSPEEQDAITAIRAAYAQAGAPNGPACCSRACLFLATTRVFWPALPGEPDPLYCAACAAWAKVVLETLGHKYRDEALPARPGPKRGIALGEVV